MTSCAEDKWKFARDEREGLGEATVPASEGVVAACVEPG